MLSIVDLIEAGTVSRDQAAYLLAAIGNGASFMVGALPGGAGKTTVMGALLNMMPPYVQLVPADCEQTVEQGLQERTRRCYICHEIGAGSYYAYLWGRPLQRYFELPAAGHLLATNLHADTFEQARAQVCGENGVLPAKFRHMNVILFLAVDRHAHAIRRQVTSIWESDGKNVHHQVQGGLTTSLQIAESTLVTAKAFLVACKTVDGLMASGARSIQEVRAFLTSAHSDTLSA